MSLLFHVCAKRQTLLSIVGKKLKRNSPQAWEKKKEREGERDRELPELPYLVEREREREREREKASKQASKQANTRQREREREKEKRLVLL